MKANENEQLMMKKSRMVRVLKALRLNADERALPNSDATQLKLTTPGFESININFYPKKGGGTVLVQPWDSPLAHKLRAVLALYQELSDHRLKNKEQK